MRSVHFEIARFPSIDEINEISDRIRDTKTPNTIEVTLRPMGGGDEFIVDVDVEVMGRFDRKDHIPRGIKGPGGRDLWRWETTINVYGQTNFPGFNRGKGKTTIELGFDILAKKGRLEAKIAESKAA